MPIAASRLTLMALPGQALPACIPQNLQWIEQVGISELGTEWGDSNTLTEDLFSASLIVARHRKSGELQQAFLVLGFR